MSDLDRKLYFAAKDGNAATVEKLIAMGAGLQWTYHGLGSGLGTGQGYSPLHAASETGQLEVVRLLLDKGAAVNAFSGGEHETALHLAAVQGELDIMRLLIERGAAVDAANEEDSRTPLISAIGSSQLEAVRLLLDKGASVNGVVGGEEELPPLHCACSRGRLEIVRLLLDRGATVDAIDDGRMTPLHRASLRGHHDIARLLIDRGAEVDAEASDGFTPLHAASHFASVGHFEVARMLVDAGADLQLQTTMDLGFDTETRIARCAIEIAERSNNVDVIELLNAVTASKEERRRLWAATWSTELHSSFHPTARRRAVDLLFIGTRLAERDLPGQEQAFLDVWKACILPAAVGLWREWRRWDER